MNTEQEQWLCALESGDLELCEELILSGCDVNADVAAFGAPPLVMAAQKGFYEIAEVLLSHGANVDGSPDKSTLHGACVYGHVSLVRLLVRHGASLAGHLTAPLSVGAIASNFEVCQTLLELGADVNQVDKNGRTALMSAVDGGNVSICRLLVERGADVHAKTAKGRTALQLAVSIDHVGAVKYLIEAGADPSLALPYRRFAPLTAFQLAVKLNRPKVLHYLLFERGEDPEQRTQAGTTMRALANRNVEPKQLLLAAKAARSIAQSIEQDQGCVEVGRRSASLAPL